VVIPAPVGAQLAGSPPLLELDAEATLDVEPMTVVDDVTGAEVVVEPVPVPVRLLAAEPMLLCEVLVSCVLELSEAALLLPAPPDPPSVLPPHAAMHAHPAAPRSVAISVALFT
jgi:hypothetical protein